ncbi:hypothetical protein Q2375_25220, partial [Escherichia coli]|nr:hypothetical protein [Escherichia coli]
LMMTRPAARAQRGVVVGEPPEQEQEAQTGRARVACMTGGDRRHDSGRIHQAAGKTALLAGLPAR